MFGTPSISLWLPKYIEPALIISPMNPTFRIENADLCTSSRIEGASSKLTRHQLHQGCLSQRGPCVFKHKAPPVMGAGFTLANCTTTSELSIGIVHSSLSPAKGFFPGAHIVCQPASFLRWFIPPDIKKSRSPHPIAKHASSGVHRYLIIAKKTPKESMIRRIPGMIPPRCIIVHPLAWSFLGK